MSSTADPTAGAPDAYEAIASAIGASARGRWFLAEHARRNRTDDTDRLLGAIARLEHTVTADRGQAAAGHLHGQLVEMAEAISRTKTEIAAIGAPSSAQAHPSEAPLALDGLVRETEQATSDILGAAEAIQEAAWTLRERGAEMPVCDVLDRHATAIYTACSFQDLTAQRTARIVYTLRYLEDRLSAMIAIWGSAPARDSARVEEAEEERIAGPQPGAEPVDLRQTDCDRYITLEVPAVTAAALVARPGSPALHEDIAFLPVSAATEPEAASTPDEPADGPVADDWAAFVAAAPPAIPDSDEPALDFAALAVLPPEQRLALFA
jgi:hypothetical protein